MIDAILTYVRSRDAPAVQNGPAYAASGAPTGRGGAKDGAAIGAVAIDAAFGTNKHSLSCVVCADALEGTNGMGTARWKAR